MNKILIKYLFIFLLFLSCSALFGQNITATYKNMPLSKVLTSISSDYKITFAFDNDLLKTIIVNKSFFKTPIEEVLKTLLEIGRASCRERV